MEKTKQTKTIKHTHKKLKHKMQQPKLLKKAKPSLHSRPILKNGNHGDTK